MPAGRKSRHIWPFLIIGTVAVLSVACMSLFVIHPPYPDRIGVAVVGDPTVIVSFDAIRKTASSVSIPSDIHVSATRGYGTYPIASVWKLDRMDKREGKLYTETLEEVVGIPVRYFIDPSGQGSSKEDPRSRIAHALSIPSAIGNMIHRNRTNIPPGLLYDLVMAYQRMDAVDLKLIDVSDADAYVKTTLPDGTETTMIDSQRMPLAIGTYFEDGTIRKENYRIAVHNATDTPGLAQNVSRIMEPLGYHIVSVSNARDRQLSGCFVVALKSSWTSATVRTLSYLYGCKPQTDENGEYDTNADITVVIGSDIGKRYKSF